MIWGTLSSFSSSCVASITVVVQRSQSLWYVSSKVKDAITMRNICGEIAYVLMIHVNSSTVLWIVAECGQRSVLLHWKDAGYGRVSSPTMRGVCYELCSDKESTLGGVAVQGSKSLVIKTCGTTSLKWGRM